MRATTRDRRVTDALHHITEVSKFVISCLFFPYPAHLWSLAYTKTLPYNFQRPQEETEGQSRRQTDQTTAKSEKPRFGVAVHLVIRREPCRRCRPPHVALFE
jgi:hypothetical protein